MCKRLRTGICLYYWRALLDYTTWIGIKSIPFSAPCTDLHSKRFWTRPTREWLSLHPATRCCRTTSRYRDSATCCSQGRSWFFQSTPCGSLSAIGYGRWTTKRSQTAGIYLTTASQCISTTTCRLRPTYISPTATPLRVQLTVGSRSWGTQRHQTASSWNESTAQSKFQDLHIDVYKLNSRRLHFSHREFSIGRERRHVTPCLSSAPSSTIERVSNSMSSTSVSTTQQ